MVHEGPMKIFETYLGEDRSKYPEQHTKQLEEAMKDFIKHCGFSIKLVNQVIELRGLKDYSEFQKVIEQHWLTMREKVKQYITDPY